MPRKLIAGNWKMHGSRAEAGALIDMLIAHSKEPSAPDCDVVICPPAQLLVPLRKVLKKSDLRLGGQNCHHEQKGAYTGEISAAMLRDAGCDFVIIGHSERRQYNGEDDDLVRAKGEAARASDLTPILCIGESAAQREAGETLEVVERQLIASMPQNGNKARLVVAYEPVWAIGSGKVPTAKDIGKVHGHIRDLLQKALGSTTGEAVRILYGGSVKPDNAAKILAIPDVDGVLVGGASLDAESFWTIACSCP